VLDVMNAAKSRPHGISFGYTGSGAQRFSPRSMISPTRAAGRKLAAGSIRAADKSFAVYDVQPLDVVFWRFTMQEGK
jgi:hypothetical protein